MRPTIPAGINVSGAGVGTIVMAPFVNALLSQHSWRATFRIQSAVVIASVVLRRPVHAHG